MQKKTLSLQVFRAVALIFLCLLAFAQPIQAQELNIQPPNPLLQGQVRKFKLFPAPKDIPDITFKDVAGRPVALSSFRGKLILITLWATWCPYCARELPYLEEAQEILGKEKFVVLPISVDKEGPEIVKKYLEEKSLNLPTYSDARDSTSKIFGTRGVPYSFLIDQDGREIGRLYGETKWSSPEAIQLLKAYIR